VTGPGGSVGDGWAQPRMTLHRVAAHVLGRRRYQVTGRFGLRASPGGFATPAFSLQGGHPGALEVLRVSGTLLVRESKGRASAARLDGSSLAQLAAFASADLSAPFSCGEDGPALGDPDEPLALEPAPARALASWYCFGSAVLDQLVAHLPSGAWASDVQLWPEHFDLATSVGAAGAGLLDAGFSPGDRFEGSPYLYLSVAEPPPGPDPSFWNAPFGALRRRDQVLGSPDPEQAALDFLLAGVAHVVRASRPGTKGA
jgi:hypothetical protein